MDLTNQLQGKVVGARINMNSGAPGGGGQIQIRGVTSLNGNGEAGIPGPYFWQRDLPMPLILQQDPATRWRRSSLLHLRFPGQGSTSAVTSEGDGQRRKSLTKIS